MDLSLFDKLEEKINSAVNAMGDLNQSKRNLQEELEFANGKIRELEAQNDDLLNNVTELESKLTEKSSSMAEAGQKIQTLIAKLESENLESVAL